MRFSTQQIMNFFLFFSSNENENEKEQQKTHGVNALLLQLNEQKNEIIVLYFFQSDVYMYSDVY